MAKTITENNPTFRERIGNLISGNGHGAEMIGRSVLGDAQSTVYKSRARVKNVDETVPDYEYWDKLRRGKLDGYYLGGLFARRIEQIFASWVFGRAFNVRLAEGSADDDSENPQKYTDSQLSSFVETNLDLFMDLEKDKLGLGDQYVIVNMDGTLSVPSPDTVEVERHPLDYRTVTAVRVETKLTEFVIVDEYREDGRTVTIMKGPEIVSVSEFENLINRIPVVHFANEMSSNETNGHSIHDTLRPLYDQYDDTIFKQLDGAKLLGNPLLTFEGMEDVSDVINANDPTEQDDYTDKDGNTTERTQLNIDQNAILIVGKGGTAKFTAPPTGFTKDTQQALKTLFLLLLDHTGIPEFIWGNELSSSRSSSEVQLTQWVRDIESRQKANEKSILDLCVIWRSATALTDTRLVLDELEVDWPPLIEEDEDLQLKRIQFAKDRGLITDLTALELLHIVADPAEEIEKSQAENEAEREREFPDGDTTDFRHQINKSED